MLEKVPEQQEKEEQDKNNITLKNVCVDRKRIRSLLKSPSKSQSRLSRQALCQDGYAHSLYLEFCTSEHTHHRHTDNVGTLMSPFPGDQFEPQGLSGRFENHAVQV